MSAHLRTFVRELSKTPLMDGLAKPSGEFYLPNSMQPIEMREHIFGLGFSGRLPKPGDYYRTQTLTRQEQGIKFATAVVIERLSQPSIEQLYATCERFRTQTIDHRYCRNNDAAAA